MTPLARMIRDLIEAEGPIPVDRYMALALGHPVHGYYMGRDPLGAAGDFTTAPEISQIFGELLGLWAADVWTRMGRPAPFQLVELGPGRGTLMADALRAARVMPEFGATAEIRLVETSAALRAAQARTLAAANPSWHARLDEVPDGPAIVLANEFLDALPIRQFGRGRAGWHERLVGLGPEGRLAFGLAAEPEPGLVGGGRPGDILEVGEAASDLVSALARRLARQGGAALFLDYGHVRTGPGDTLQAVRRHAYADPLADPGEQDLTAHVDFAALGRAATGCGATVHGPVEQGGFLRNLGIEVRAAALKRRATPAQAADIEGAVARLVGADAMGRLFKAMGLSDPTLSSLPGLPTPTPAAAARAQLEAAC